MCVELYIFDVRVYTCMFRSLCGTFFATCYYIPLSSMGDHAEMLRKTKLLAETTASVIGLLKMEADDEMDPAARQLLLDAARALADATSHMVEAAKMAAQNPGVGDLDFVCSKT